MYHLGLCIYIHTWGSKLSKLSNWTTAQCCRVSISVSNPIRLVSLWIFSPLSQINLSKEWLYSLKKTKNQKPLLQKCLRGRKRKTKYLIQRSLIGGWGEHSAASKNLGVEMQSERVHWRSNWAIVLHLSSMFLWLGEGIRIQVFDRCETAAGRCRTWARISPPLLTACLMMVKHPHPLSQETLPRLCAQHVISKRGVCTSGYRISQRAFTNFNS